ncbi:BTB/POZ domain [Popillia japonica]|uniref:BTB/POZ domain n=1 Tax=Popillia japonica TaxID=7064 RepID=A0AAW1KFY1_POPJA
MRLKILITILMELGSHRDMEGEQFSLCWNNFHNNLSSGFHTLLQDEDLVDVTLAAEGKYLKAHKTVLSVCSPYFKELFRVNPCKHPIVILQDVSYNSLHNLLQFMYQGEVSVSQEEIPTFMRVAEMLKVKGLTDNSTSADTNGLDTHKNTYTSSASDNKQFLKRRLVKKIIKPIQHLKPIEPPQKPSPMSRSISHQTPAAKQHRYEDSPAHASEYLPVAAVNTKQEPIDHMDECLESSYEGHTMDMSSMLDTTLGEPSDSKTSTPLHKLPMDASSPGGLVFLKSRKGHPVLIHNGHIYALSNKRDNRNTWVCVKQKTLKCEGCVTTTSCGGPMLLSYSGHNHAQLNDVIQRLQASSCSPSPELL